MGFRPHAQLISCTAGSRFNRIEKGPKMGPKGILEKYRRMYRADGVDGPQEMERN